MKSILLLIAAFFLFGCVQPPQPQPTEIPAASLQPTDDLPPPPPDDNFQPTPECTKDSDCKVTGCSGTVCSSENVVTTCEYREEYACYKQISCGCVSDSCAWKETPEFNACLENARKNTNDDLPPLPV